MNKEELAAEAQRAVEELIEVSGCRAGQVLVVGCSTSEIVGGKGAAQKACQCDRHLYGG